MKIWITGIAGFLGSHLADALISEGHSVFGNDSLICGDKANYSGLFVEKSCQDWPVEAFADNLRYGKTDVLVHCAATAHEGLSNFSPSFITKNIYEASVATFSAAITAGVKRIVFLSSMARYGTGSYAFKQMGTTGKDITYTPIMIGPPFDESYEPRPVDPYGIAKVAAEDTLRVLCNTHGVKYSILVPHSIIGTRQRYTDPHRNVASIMINRCLQGKSPIIYGDGLQTRCFSPVADCIPSILRAINGEADGEVVNIGPDSGEITVLELAKKIADLTGYDGEFEFHLDRPNEVKHAYCSSDKVRRLLGYEEKQSIDDCLAEMVEDIKKKGTKSFDYSFPLEIVTERTPRTWVEKLI